MGVAGGRETRLRAFFMPSLEPLHAIDIAVVILEGNFFFGHPDVSYSAILVRCMSLPW